MIYKEVLLIACVVAAASSHPCNCEEDKVDYSKFHEKHEKCVTQTRYLNGCCKFPMDAEYADHLECKPHFDKIKSAEDEVVRKLAGACFSECVFKKNDIIDDQGKIDKEKLKTHAGKYVVDHGAPELKKIFQNSLDLCYEMSMTNKEKWKKYHEYQNLTLPAGSDIDPNCNRIPAGLMLCAMADIARNCPTSRWEANEQCEQYKAEATSFEECMKF